MIRMRLETTYKKLMKPLNCGFMVLDFTFAYISI